MGDPLLPGKLGDVVWDGAQRQIDDLARVGRDVRWRGMNQIAVEHQNRAGFARRCSNTAVVSEISVMSRQTEIARRASNAET